VLVRVEGWPVAVRQANVLATTFHPELVGDPRIHAWLVDSQASRPE
jgi:5'-phosphate synthase pdxT subunit